MATGQPDVGLHVGSHADVQEHVRFASTDHMKAKREYRRLPMKAV